MKKKELSGNISKFPPVQWQPIIVNYFLFSLSLLNKEELKANESLKPYNQFTSGWVNKVKTKLFLNCLLKLPWLLEGSVRNVFPSSFCYLILIRCIVFTATYNQFTSRWVNKVKTKLSLNCLLKLPQLLERSVRNVLPSSFCYLILIRCTVFTALAKIPEREGSISPSRFYWQFPNYQSQVLANCNWTQTQNHSVLKRTLNHLVKLAKWLSRILSTYLYGALDSMFLSCHVDVLGQLSVRLRTKWFWVRVQLQSFHLQISHLLRARSSLTFRQL